MTRDRRDPASAGAIFGVMVGAVMRRSAMKATLLLWLPLLIFWAAAAQAHEVRPAYLKLTELDSAAAGERFEASLRQPQIDGRYLGLQLITNCESAPVSAGLTSGALIEVFELNCGESALETLEIQGLERTLIDTLVSIEFRDGGTRELLINGDAPRVDLSTAAPALPVYLSIGIEHLVFGFDHVLFVIMLLYIVRKPLEILKVVTSFTLAHSLTLALSALDLITLSSAPVEAIIAGSIALLAYENLSEKPSLTKQYPAIIAFLFGLLHGLGFAGALAEIGLPENSQITALFLFNLGIELGQLAIIAAVLSLLAITRLPRLRLLHQLPLYATGGIAAHWFIERSWQIFSPLA